MHVTTAKLAEIKLTSQYLRLDTDVSALKKSVESVGLIHPVTVNQDRELLAGARRFQAVRELGWEELPVQVVDRDSLAQELISIDENLVRSPLGPIELERYLNRGREIYEALHPDANKVDLSADEPTAEQKLERREQEAQDEDSFAAVTAQKTGLSKAVIQGAIKRDALASDEVKRARSEGELNATATNEVIKLDRETQAKVLPLIAGKTAAETRRIVAAARAGGLDAAVEESEQVVPLPREYREMLAPVKRVNKSISRILIEELRYEGPQQRKINNELMTLKNNLVQYFRMVGIEK
ncbi:ParB/RepB/Spo0J family partition protein [Engelhardtia mirabilis]|uniref:Nucleoid occlusion protein n=1 Tax=Engelhardtia mirabilis TaxID=2528011 RepID=A0A518BSK4_9BACT|nr:Nucleoid occlusion protein [Planctomycetes bacterium Pla133]QDV04275.1 Nucleoid occlusion protein [Planctomycetes bacterium Pla86]